MTIFVPMLMRRVISTKCANLLKQPCRRLGLTAVATSPVKESKDVVPYPPRYRRLPLKEHCRHDRMVDLWESQLRSNGERNYKPVGERMLSNVLGKHQIKDGVFLSRRHHMSQSGYEMPSTGYPKHGMSYLLVQFDTKKAQLGNLTPNHTNLTEPGLVEINVHMDISTADLFKQIMLSYAYIRSKWVVKWCVIMTEEWAASQSQFWTAFEGIPHLWPNMIAKAMPQRTKFALVPHYDGKKYIWALVKGRHLNPAIASELLELPSSDTRVIGHLEEDKYNLPIRKESPTITAMREKEKVAKGERLKECGYKIRGWRAPTMNTSSNETSTLKTVASLEEIVMLEILKPATNPSNQNRFLRGDITSTPDAMEHSQDGHGSTTEMLQAANDASQTNEDTVQNSDLELVSSIGWDDEDQVLNHLLYGSKSDQEDRNAALTKDAIATCKQLRRQIEGSTKPCTILQTHMEEVGDSAVEVSISGEPLNQTGSMDSMDDNLMNFMDQVYSTDQELLSRSKALPRLFKIGQIKRADVAHHNRKGPAIHFYQSVSNINNPQKPPKISKYYPRFNGPRPEPVPQLDGASRDICETLYADLPQPLIPTSPPTTTRTRSSNRLLTRRRPSGLVGHTPSIIPTLTVERAYIARLERRRIAHSMLRFPYSTSPLDFSDTQAEQGRLELIKKAYDDALLKDMRTIQRNMRALHRQRQELTTKMHFVKHQNRIDVASTHAPRRRTCYAVRNAKLLVQHKKLDELRRQLVSGDSPDRNSEFPADLTRRVVSRERQDARLDKTLNLEREERRKGVNKRRARALKSAVEKEAETIRFEEREARARLAAIRRRRWRVQSLFRGYGVDFL
ncbi:hypothetical protein BJ878DRAFT_514142 [Calycina marina]|uniref:Uncharacterized protein n=1 Tax=Calycina marina TaxID=1763456 RepID=A0A9P8CDG1_9HELO|nr:hypothetical protein BJ878DRAFT_514142 [Calycina marina]